MYESSFLARIEYILYEARMSIGLAERELSGVDSLPDIVKGVESVREQLDTVINKVKENRAHEEADTY